VRVTVVGTGYIGLVTAACLADRGHHVFCVDTDPARLAAIEAGRAPFHEPGLDDLLRAGRASGRLAATPRLEEAVRDSALTIVAVGTPARDGAIDLAAVLAAAAAIGGALASRPDGHVVAIKSTVVPGTTMGPVRATLERAAGRPLGAFGLAVNPEFTREGTAVADFLDPDRIVVGHADGGAAAVLRELYADFACPQVFTTPGNAEMIKYTANALLATLVSFGNEIAGLCEQSPETDARVVLEGVLLDRRCGVRVADRHTPPGLLDYLVPGIGFGGSCLPKDVQALAAYGRSLGRPMALLEGTLAVNRDRAAALVEQARALLGDLAGAEIAVLGLAFKPGTDDVRDSPALALVARLLDAGAAVRVYDPVAAVASLDPAVSGRVRAAPTPEDAAEGADAILLATAWPEFRGWDWPRLTRRMRRRLVGDGRGLLAEIAWPDDVTYFRVGTMTARNEKEPTR
jgi:UDPglucose 6-dehydrogenase